MERRDDGGGHRWPPWNYVCSTLNGKHTPALLWMAAREGGIGKFIDDFQKNIQIWFQFPLPAAEWRGHRNRKSTRFLVSRARYMLDRHHPPAEDYTMYMLVNKSGNVS